jgi:DNA mismatch repair protein MutS
VFLHRISEGAADRSYGIHVAQLAGLPSGIIERAQEVLHELENQRTPEHLDASRAGRRRSAGIAPELPLFAAAEPPILDALRATNPESLTPLEALRVLDEWKKRWGGTKSE